VGKRRVTCERGDVYYVRADRPSFEGKECRMPTGLPFPKHCGAPMHDPKAPIGNARGGRTSDG
jgi:hypothetical protein